MGVKKTKPTQVVVKLSSRRFPRRRLLGLMVVLLLVAVAAVMAVFLLNKDDDVATKVPKPTTTSGFIESSDSLKYSKDYNRAADMAAEGYDVAKTEDEKYNLAQKTASVYETAKDYKNAIKWYHKAGDIKPGLRGSLVGLARCYEADGQKDKAIEYYKKVIALKDETGIGVQNEQAYYQFRLDQLTGATQ